MLSVLKLCVRCGKSVATRVEVCYFVPCKWPCPFVMCLGMSIVGVRGVGQFRVLMVGLYESVKDGIGVYCLRVNEVIVFNGFSIQLSRAK